LDIGALFLTADHALFSFDWHRLRTEGTHGHVILPNQLLQLIRPFLVVTAEFNEKFAATFAIPEFRTAASDYSSTISKVLGYLATFADVSEETATRILANEVLLGRLRELKPDSHEFKEVVDSALIKDNKNLLQENEQLLAQVKATESAKQDVSGTLETKEQLIERQQQLLKEKEAVAQRQQADLADKSRELEAERAARAEREAQAADLQKQLRSEQSQRVTAQLGERRASQTLRFIIAAVFWLFAVGGIIAANSYWPWLNQHSKRLGLVITGLLFVTAVSWCIADQHPKRRGVAIVAVIIGAILSLTQIVDPDHHPDNKALGQPSQAEHRP
jgi:hypothetical protein